MTKAPLKVLIVEDDPINRLLEETILERQGFDVTSCSDGQDAVARVVDQATRFDVILMDVMLPGLDGIEATRRIRSVAAGQGTRILCVTAQASPEVRNAILEAGCDAVLTKPFSPRVLLKAVESLAGVA